MFGSSCPKCGYCSHCGRGGHDTRPHIPIGPQMPQFGWVERQDIAKRPDVDSANAAEHLRKLTQFLTRDPTRDPKATG